MKITTFSTLTFVLLTLFFSACSNAVNTTVNNSTVTIGNKSNTAIVVNSNQASVNNTAPVSNTKNASNDNQAANNTSSAPTPANNSEAETIRGELQPGKTESVILYVGNETGDYAAYCFANDSEAGRAILAACKDKENCEVNATIGEGTCKVPGLEADLSASGKILKVDSVKTLGRKK
jgi:hypothetical protein